MPKYTEESSLADIVINNPLTSRLFHEVGLDFCCGGRSSLKGACREKGLETRAILDQLEGYGSASRELQVTESTRPGEVIDYILERFHATHRAEIPALEFLSEKVARVHGDRHPELLEVKRLFERLVLDLDPHMLKEEKVLFPMIGSMEEALSNAVPFGGLHCASIGNPIGQMEFEHESVGALLSGLRAVTRGFLVPEGACNSYLALYTGLEKLESDLHLHIHYENNVLHPMARRLEKAVL